MWNPAPLHGFNVVSAILCPAQSSIINKVNSRPYTNSNEKGIERHQNQTKISNQKSEDLRPQSQKLAKMQMRARSEGNLTRRLQLAWNCSLRNNFYARHPRLSAFVRMRTFTYIYIHSRTITYNQRIFRFISTSRLTQVPRALRVSQLTFYARCVPTFLPRRVHRAKTRSLSKTTNNCPALSNVWQMDSVGR